MSLFNTRLIDTIVKRVHEKRAMTSRVSSSYEVNVSDFIPITCHYNEHTILTKNGELLQTIRIEGFSFEEQNEDVELREYIRAVLLQHIDNSVHFSFWFHTVRVKRNLVSRTFFEEPFCSDLHDSWCRKNYWDDKFINELYITILYQSKHINLWGADMLRAIHPKGFTSLHMEYLNTSYNALNSMVEKTLEDLSAYGAKRLAITEDKEGIYSECVQFFATLSHLSDERIPLSIIDLSQYIGLSKIAFGNNTIELHSGNSKHFAAIVSLKEFYGLSSGLIDRFLQLPIKFVITQTFNFCAAPAARKHFEYQNYILKISKAEELRQITGLTDMIENESESNNAFGEEQTTIMVVADTQEKLNSDLERIVTELKGLGLLSVREDLALEQAFWAQIPGNFNHITRRRPTHYSAMAEFCSLYNFPVGHLSTPWGKPVTLFRTVDGTPYFFNFHTKGAGNTFILGGYHRSITTLMNFLCAMAMNKEVTLYSLSLLPHENVFIHAINGSTQTLSRHPLLTSMHLNPFQLESSKETITFLTEWLSILFSEDTRPGPLMVEKIRAAVLYVLEQPKENRSLRLALEWLVANAGTDTNSAPATLQALCAEWVGGGPYAYLFDHADDSLSFQGHHHTDLSDVLDEKPHIQAAVFAYYFYRLRCEMTQNNRKIFTLDKIRLILINPLCARYFKEYIGALNAANGVLIARSKLFEHNSDTAVIDFIKEKSDTTLFFPDKTAYDIYQQHFGLSQNDIKTLSSKLLVNRLFMIQQEKKNILLEMNLTGMDQYLKILEGGENSFDVMRLAIQERGLKVSDWLPLFYKAFGGKA